jgi:hypothetical protein
MIADMSVAPEIARLAETVLLAPPRPAAGPHPDGPDPDGPDPDGPDPDGLQGADAAAARLTLGTMARQVRAIAATPERWWGLVRFERGRPVRISVETHPSYVAWLVVLPPGDSGQSCDCDVVTMIAGEATEGSSSSAPLRPGPLRVHGQRHWLRGQGTGYSISLHARISTAESAGSAGSAENTESQRQD